ncbi:YkuS family protein [Bacillus sp. FJAT-42376]|uniref:YkuS family protein n=1 Tax=Bacillus sp. FJAT-42376 TaxID=2014076 RepID=UPI000F4DA3FE|nr:YkuS family protein [Bacillus sp. FJAT-42376]AZB42640.1 YkuS family protein [Bacillus sp. FJAT-42376]
MPRIGVEQSLTNVEEALKSMGYDVVQIRSEEDAQNCDCCVVTGLDNNIMGISNTVTEGSVIEASGLSAEEICQQVQHRFNQ